MHDLMQPLAAWLEQGEPVVQAVVLGREGSAPRGSGAVMLVRADGETLGTVGGGRLEADVRDAALRLFDAGPEAIRFLVFSLSNDDAALSDMICGGTQEVVIQRYAPDAAPLCRKGVRALAGGRDVVVLHDLGPDSPDSDNAADTGVAEGDESDRVHGRWVVTDAERGEVGVEVARLALSARREPENAIFVQGGRRWLALVHPQPGTMVLFGAGHVSQHTARAARHAGFRVVVLDDRPEFAHPARFPDADRIEVVEAFDTDFAKLLDIGPNHYLVVVTRGHAHDKTVLGRLLHTDAAYIGMIGSTKKRDAIYSALLAEGAKQEALDKVFCPIGLAIGAETPEEIAVSIVAEMIRARALRRGTSKRV